MELIQPPIENYAALLTSDQNDLLNEVEHFTNANHPKAHMISGRVQGRILSLLSRMMQPEFILEIGTFTGFSALCLAEGLKPGGELHTIDIREEDANTAKGFFDRSTYRGNIKLHIGDARQIIPDLQRIWDIVFIDADKTGYIEYYELILPSVKKNGLIIADNVLFHGDVLQDPIKGKNAIAIDTFNRHVLADDRVDQVLLTQRDGLLVIMKK